MSPMPNDTAATASPAPEVRAREIAESVHAAYCQRAEMPIRPLEEQTVVARLVEAIRPEIEGTSPGAIVAAANAVLDAWEARDPEVRGPRVAGIDAHDGRVSMRPR